MRFKFPFQKIMDLKSNEKSQAEWMLSSALVQLNEEEQLLHQLQVEKDQIQDHWREYSAVSMPAADLQMMHQYIHHLDSQIERKQRDIEKAQSDVSDKQQNLSSRMLDEKVWSKAKEKALIQYQRLVQKQEQEQLDELATVRFTFKT